MTRLQAAEEAIYQSAADPLVNWDLSDLATALRTGGFSIQAPLRLLAHEEERQITTAQLERWFTVSPAHERPSYATHLLQSLSHR